MFASKIPEASNVLRAKCIVAGDAAVGKTALTQVLLSDGTLFPKTYTMNCGIDLQMKTINIPESNDVVELFIYDSPGKELFTDMLKKYWNQPSLVCIVYDVTNDASIQNCLKWKQLIDELSADIVGNIPGVLIANKVDLKERRTVAPKTGVEMAKKLDLVYFECSAKENQGIDEPFYYLASEWHKLYQDKTSSFKTVT